MKPKGWKPPGQGGVPFTLQSEDEDEDSGRNPITFSDPLGRDGVTSNPIQDPVDSGFLPPGLTTFGKGAR